MSTKQTFCSFLTASVTNALILLFALPTALAQESSMEVVSVDSTKVKKKRVPLRPTGIRLGFDPSRHIIALFSKFYDSPLASWEVQGDITLNNRWFLSAAYGFSELARSDVSVGKRYFYTNQGNYARFGLDYNLLGGKTQYDAVYLGIRYNLATFEHRITGLFPRPYWADPRTNSENQAINEEESDFNGLQQKGLEANWTSLVLGFRVMVFPNFFASLEGRLDNLGFLSDSEGFSVIDIPGYGILREDQGAKYNFGYSLMYKIPLWPHPKYLKK